MINTQTELPSRSGHDLPSKASLSEFLLSDPKPGQWTRRFFERYGKELDEYLIDNNLKKTYLVRAATEFHEVCSESFNHCPDAVIWYAAVKSGNWSVLTDRLASRGWDFSLPKHDTHVVGQAFASACRLNLVDVVKQMAAKCLEFVDKQEDFIHTQEVYDIIRTSLEFRERYEPQLVAFQSLEQFKQYSHYDDSRQWSPGFLYDLFSNVVYEAGKYNKNEPDHWHRVLQKIQLIESDNIVGDPDRLALYLNQPIEATSSRREKIITQLATASMGDWLKEYRSEPDTTEINVIKKFYDLLPNSHERALGTIKILESYASFNKILHKYATLIKVVIGTCSDVDIRYFERDYYPNPLVEKILDNANISVILELNKIVKNFYLCNYRFTSLPVLKAMLLCDNIIVSGSCDFSQFISLPLYDEINRSPAKNDCNKLHILETILTALRF